MGEMGATEGVMEMPHHTDGAIMAHRLVTLLILTAVHLYLMGPAA